METLLCAAIFVDDPDSALAACHRAAEHGADLVELRLDRFTDDADAAIDLVNRCPLPAILTVRSAEEGGDYDGDDTTRVSFLEAVALATQPSYVDLELATYQRSANLRQKVGLIVDHPEQQRPTPTGLILSTHDFDRRPADLERRVLAMADAPACRVIKAAWKARSLRDNLEAFDLVRARHKPTIALCMGEYGLPSRVLAKKFGALLTFAAVDQDAGTAPGQPTLDELKNLYRWDALNADTAVFGVIGHPVGHSLSPAIHNAGFDHADFNGVYLPLPIPPEYEHFKATVLTWLEHAGLDFRGASVTIPHKANLLRFVEEQGGEIEPLSIQIGAANTLVKRDDGSLYCCNTDYAAAIDSLCEVGGMDREAMADKRIAVLGAGGAARAIVAGLSDLGATVVIYNRTREKADALAEAFADAPGKVVAAPLENLCKSCCHAVVNCTPLGMHPHVDASPIDPDEAPWGENGSGVVVFDTIYNPAETKLLRDARAAGCATVSGVEMFVRQAKRQFELWTKREAPLEVFRRVVEQSLQRRE